MKKDKPIKIYPKNWNNLYYEYIIDQGYVCDGYLFEKYENYGQFKKRLKELKKEGYIITTDYKWWYDEIYEIIGQ